ncbi:FkbM family methyltransferase [Cytophagaceae bacterium DM2B3-1]|uniref:FkbM family methyltransferase n=1 Tax=Xanthocytophaga flava TaxID=3048013 RepID=A0ABT7CFX2_9BACT|nr:FkbM family methyltransferase [Xanthocytophaga flavus]MDJ1491962.1 FkbM family methyltransferase [Xanthocytophaga flavus]
MFKNPDLFMKKILVILIDLILNPIYGKKQFQSFFGFLYGISIKGFNLRHRSINDSGEEWLVEKLYKYFDKNQIKPLILDVGANEGQYAQYLVQNFGEQMDLKCFEPLPTTFQILSQKLASHPHISFYPFGLGDTPGSLTFFTSSQDSTLNSLYSKRDDVINKYDGQTEIEIKCLSEFCLTENISHVHFMKIDVEGNELAVLKGGKKLLESQQIDFIQFEFGSRNIDSRTYFEDFFNLLGGNYSLFRIMRNGLYPLTNYNYDYEIFAIGNYLAISRRINLDVFLKS